MAIKTNTQMIFTDECMPKFEHLKVDVLCQITSNFG